MNQTGGSNLPGYRLAMSRPRSAPIEPSVLGLVAIGTAAALWAIAAAVASDLFDRGVKPLELAEARSVIAVVGFGAIALLRRERRRAARVPAPHLIALGLSIALVNAAYYLAIDHLDVAVAIVLQYTAPAFVVTYAALRLKRMPDVQITTALGLALIGVVVASEVPAGDLGNLDLVGILFGLASGVLFATYTLLSEAVGAAYGPIGGMLRAFTVAATFWLVYQSFNGWPGELFVGRNLIPILYVGIAGTLIPFLLYVWAIGHVVPERAAIAATLEPALAGVVAFIWLDEALSAMQIAGGILVLAAIVTLQVRRKARIAPEP